MDKKYVFSLGLPRTGGTTLANALRALGYHGTNTCMLTNVRTISEPRYEFTPYNKKFNIDNEAPIHFSQHTKEEFYIKYSLPSYTKFIITTRKQVNWLKSLAKFGYIPGNSIPLMKEYEDKVRATIDTDKILWIDWNICSKTGELLNSSSCWQKLCTFLDEPYDADNLPTFPCENC